MDGECESNLGRARSLVRRSILPHIYIVAAMLGSALVIGHFLETMIAPIITPIIILFCIISFLMLVLALVNCFRTVSTIIYITVSCPFYILGTLLLAELPSIAPFILIPSLVVYVVIGIHGMAKGGYIVSVSAHKWYWGLVLVSIVIPSLYLMFLQAGPSLRALTWIDGYFPVYVIVAALALPLWLGGTYLSAASEIAEALEKGSWLDGLRVVAFHSVEVLGELLEIS
jgi:hypothetical protein